MISSYEVMVALAQQYCGQLRRAADVERLARNGRQARAVRSGRPGGAACCGR
jgi:hypothetical protein